MPYIPDEHKKYNLLPQSCLDGGEVFSYDSDLVYGLESLLDNKYSLIPYGYDSYEEYYEHLDSISAENPSVKEKIEELKKDIKKRNIKENWSIAKYVGDTTDGVFGLTHDRYYYFPCSADDITYDGIIDDEEFTSYMNYPLSKSLWEIVEDPLKLLERVLH
ncbi:MAG: hypothetical protein BWY15_02360 [Firmicutes bacterium ADurb.Bin193]|nr:MAG: hypothetical protein BWY15_02360 [Firmicutes bacterium ADurb.Bin193]